MTMECIKMEDSIMNTWFPKVINLLTSKETLSGIKEEKMESFFNCASTLMSNQVGQHGLYTHISEPAAVPSFAWLIPFPQLKSLLQSSVEEFVSIFDPVEYHRVPLFQMALTFDDEKIEIYPTLQDLEAAVLEILTTITTTLQVRTLFRSTSTLWWGIILWAYLEGCDVKPQKVQTIQSWLGQGRTSYVDAKVTDDLRTWAVTSVKATLHKNLEGPELHFQHYSEFLQCRKRTVALCLNTFSVVFSQLPFLIVQSPIMIGWWTGQQRPSWNSLWRRTVRLMSTSRWKAAANFIIKNATHLCSRPIFRKPSNVWPPPCPAACGGLQGRVERDCLPLVESLLPNGSSGLWRAETGIGQQSQQLRRAAPGEDDHKPQRGE